MQERRASLLADGKITLEQYDQAISDLEEGKMPMLFDRGHGGPDRETVSDNSQSV